MKSAIIGLGAIAPVHYAAIRRAGGEVVALCDVSAAQADAFRARTGATAPVYADWRAMLREVRPEAVHICTPHYLHADMICEALSLDINVLCEKPLCIREEDIARILAAEAGSRGRLGVCHQNRYNHSNLAAKQLAGEKPEAGYGSVVWERGVPYYNSAEWRGKWATEGGGVMINQALHTLDLLIWLMGMPDTVIATTENRHLGDAAEVEDTAAALFGYADGRSFNFFATNAGGADFPIQVMLSAGGRKIVAAYGTLTVDGVIQSTAGHEAPTGKEVWGDGHAHLVADFYDACRTGRPFAIDGREAACVVRAILALYRSHGEKVTITKGETL